MQLGFLTGALGGRPLTDKLDWARDAGFTHVELSCWPLENSRDYSGSDVPVVGLDADGAAAITTEVADRGLQISALAYYDNMLHHDEATRTGFQDHLAHVIDAAALLGVPYVGTFIGRNERLSIVDNFGFFAEQFEPLIDYATTRGVLLMIENCPMPVWERDGFAGTISYSPELWREMFRIFPEGLALNFDPSHLVWLQIDPYRALEEFIDKVVHVHAKDTALVTERLYDYGIYGKQLDKAHPFDLGWLAARIPGRGDLDWGRFLGDLRRLGYRGVVSIEHEDPEFEGSDALVEEGLRLGRQHLLAAWQQAGEATSEAAQ